MTQTASTTAASAKASAKPAPLIRLFKVGQFVSAEGERASFSLADLKATAAAYNADNDPAPIVIGHPQMNDPAYGWIKSLRVEGDELLAEPGEIDASFAEAVRQGRYGKVSAQFYKRGHPSSPSPDNYALRHVGFFGAHPVAVKGLGRVSFSEADDTDLAIVNTLEEDHPVTDPDTKSTDETKLEGVEPTASSAAGTTTEATTAAPDDAVAQENARLKEQLAERDQADAAKARDAQHATNLSYAEGLVAAGKLKPAFTAKLVGLLDGPDAAGTFSFGEGAEEASTADVVREILEEGRPELSFGEHPDAGAPGTGGMISFAMPAGHTASDDQIQRMAKVSQLMTADGKLTLIEATRQVDAAA